MQWSRTELNVMASETSGKPSGTAAEGMETNRRGKVESNRTELGPSVVPRWGFAFPWGFFRGLQGRYSELYVCVFLTLVVNVGKEIPP